jgi:hypothetical protein
MAIKQTGNRRDNQNKWEQHVRDWDDSGLISAYFFLRYYSEEQILMLVDKHADSRQWYVVVIALYPEER